MNDDFMDSQVILKFGYYCKMVISLRAATQIMGVLAKENVLKADTKYESNVSTEILTPWGTDEITIAMISPAEILLRCAAGEKK